MGRTIPLVQGMRAAAPSPPGAQTASGNGGGSPISLESFDIFDQGGRRLDLRPDFFAPGGD